MTLAPLFWEFVYFDSSGFKPFRKNFPLQLCISAVVADIPALDTGLCFYIKKNNQTVVFVYMTIYFP